ncbi:MAG: hypothetical protein FWC43_11995, partial [Planctomycetaceae bacterium]|nr:hypothetical protein [Planctomycetaceae bacterium]
MQFPSLTTSVSPTGGSTTLSGAQVDLFLEQMRQQTSQSNEAKRREKRELAEQVQRNLEKRKNELQHTRLQMIADSRQTQDRRARLDAIDDRRALRRAELDRKERNAKF